MEKDDRIMLKELIRQSERCVHVEDAYSVAHIDDDADYDFMTVGEIGFMRGFIA